MFEDVAPISPIEWFAFTVPIIKGKKEDLFSKKSLLFSPAKIAGEEEFAKVYVVWNEKKLLFRIVVEEAYEQAYFPDFRKGDSVELFIDTLNLKKKRLFGASCHHFVFFPEKIEGSLAKEVSKFRGEDAHDLAEAKDLLNLVDMEKKRYTLNLEIPNYCLHGYEPSIGKKIGFTYQINRSQNPPQHFSLSSYDFLPEKNPHLWATLELKS